ncbi:MAG: sulfurtransferase [Proteobacteria bacterium]|nr:sulfurtransferase [Pseudomonadota bacterium]
MFTNISTYRFAPLSNLKPLREHLLEKCKGWGLKGTILLSTEGINMFVAGPREKIDSLMQEVWKIPGLEGLKPKYSESAHQPFTRMLVRIKKEIIAFGVEGIDPAKRTSPKLKAAELKKWLDEGRPVTLLDTRNNYEVKLGTFDKALPIGVNHFRDFPAAVAKLPEKMKEEPVVMFCTGGIRCEKAGPYMESVGFKNIFQLEGGILKYFEEVGGAHYQGDCFVFDQRVGVDPSLAETPDSQCFACLAPLKPEEQKDSRYVLGKSCPYCYVSTDEKRKESMLKHQAAFDAFKNNLPGKAPYENHRPVKVPKAFDGKTILDFLSEILHHIPAGEWQSEIEMGKILNSKFEVVKPNHKVKAGERYLHKLPKLAEPDVNAAVKLLYEDEMVIVIDKPAPLPVHAGGRFNRNTLQYLLNEVYAPQRPRPAHRLDANTSGIMVIARSRHSAGALQTQFAQGQVEKVYRATVQGHPKDDSFVCEVPISAAPDECGSRTVAIEEGLEAKTEFKVLERFPDGTALIEARPITGRTNQIRIHLWHLGFPIVGEKLYLPNQKMGNTQTQSLDDEPLALRSVRVTFTHPLTREKISFQSSSL